MQGQIAGHFSLKVQKRSAAPQTIPHLFCSASFLIRPGTPRSPYLPLLHPPLSSVRLYI